MAAPQASSRLELLQARFQQKQLQEKEQKLLQLYDQQQQRAYQVVQRGSAGSNNPHHGSTVTTVTRSSSSTHTTSTAHGGKMFDERRQTGVKGIDRSYPLEPLDNKPRKQTNGLASQRNGNFTVSRQSVTVKRVARADVNSNLNGGKPVISYHEEVTRESFGSPDREDKGEFGSENHLSRYANGNGEVRIEDVLDSSDGDRMPGKFHLMEYEEGTKQRVRNDLEGEEFPEDLLVDVTDKLPKRTATRKLSQAEARLERFKNANAKRTTPPRNTTTTFTKKRTEPLYPAKSISSNTDANRSRLSELISDKSTRSPTPTTSVILTISKRNSSRSPSTESRRSMSPIEKARSRLSSPELIRSVKEEIDKPDFFCVESERSATTYSAKPTISWTNKTKRPLPSQSSRANTKIGSAQLMRKKRSERPEFFCKENDRSATTYSLKPRPIGSKNPTAGTKSVGRKSRENDSQDGSSRAKYFCREGERSATTMSIDALDTRVQSVLQPDRIVRRPGESVQSVSGNCKATSATDVKSKPRITRLSEREKQVYRGARTSPGFFGPDSEKSATTMTVVPETIRKSRAITSPEAKKREDSRSKKPCFNHTGPSVSLKDLRKESPRSGSPKYFDGGTERKASGTSIDTKAPVRRSPSPEKLIEKRESSPEFFCRESEKSATTISLKPRVSNGSIGGLSKSPRSEQQKPTPRNGGPTGSDRKSVNQYQSTRRMSKSPENSAPFGNRKGTCRKGSAHVLRSIDLIRAVISRQDEAGNAFDLSRKQRALDKKRASIKSDESDGVSLGKVGYKLSAGGNNSRPRTPVNSCQLTTPGSSPRSFSSAEGVAEIQEITLSHRYVRGDKVDDTEKEAGDRSVGRVVGRTYSKSCSQKGSSSSENSKSDSPTTYSVGKSCKKRVSLLKPNIFVPMCTRTREQGSTSRRRSSSDLKSSCEAGRTVSLRQITRNKSQVGRSPVPSPHSRPSSSLGKLPFCMANRRASGDNLNREITGERETSGSPRQTSASPTARLRNRELPINSSRSIFGENPKKCRSGKSSTARAPVSPSSGRRLPENSSRSDGADTLRSTDLVRRAMDVRDERGSRKISLGGNKNQGDRETAGTSIEDHNTVDSKAGAFDEEKHKVVKKDKVVYPGLADEKLKNLSTSSREIEKMNMRITDSTGKGNESTDYARTDSVESALRRFDSIGAESTRTFTLGSFSQSNLHTAEEHETIVTESKTQRSSEETLSLKGLDQQKPASPLRFKSPSPKPVLRKTSATLSKTPKSGPKGTLKSSVTKMSRSPDIRSKKKFAKARDSIEIVRFSTKSQTPGCRRRLFDSDSGKETALKSAASKKAIIQKQVSSEKLNQDSSEPDSSVSPKQLRSIEDIRKSMKSSDSSNVSFSRLSIVRRKETRAKPAIAYKVRQSPTTLKLESRSGPISSVYRSRATSCWKSGGSSPGGKDLFLKDRTPLSRITKSPSPEPASRKVTEAVRTSTGRRSVPPSPSKSPETAARAPPESKATRRPVAAGSKRSTFATAKKSPDATDGLENGLHPQEPVAEGKQREDIVHTSSSRKADAFVIDFDEPPAREREPAQARKPLPRKQSAEKLTSPTTPARPPSSVSSTSSGSPHGSKSKMSGRPKSKSMLNAASTSRTSASMKNTGSHNAADNLMACKTCGRHFATDRVRFHEEICTKTAQKKRKQFDAMLFRVRGTELEPFMKKGLIKKNDSRSSKAEVKSDWRKKHEDFINAIRSAKQVQAHLAAGGKLSDLPPPPPSDYSDYIQCPHCGRKFNQGAAERHIPKCENMLHNKPTHSRPPKPRR